MRATVVATVLRWLSSSEPPSQSVEIRLFGVQLLLAADRATPSLAAGTHSTRENIPFDAGRVSAKLNRS